MKKGPGPFLRNLGHGPFFTFNYTNIDFFSQLVFDFFLFQHLTKKETKFFEIWSLFRQYFIQYLSTNPEQLHLMHMLL